MKVTVAMPMSEGEHEAKYVVVESLYVAEGGTLVLDFANKDSLRFSKGGWLRAVAEDPPE